MAKYSFIVSLPFVDYNEQLKRVIKTATRYAEKVCYVTINKTSQGVKEILKEAEIPFEQKFYFIDGISKTILAPKREKGVIFIAQPFNLKEFDRAIKKAVLKEGTDQIIFDSLSNLTVYNREEEIISYLIGLIAWLTEKKVTIIFVCLSGDQENKIIKNLG